MTTNVIKESEKKEKNNASSESWTHDPWFTRPVLCHWAIEADMKKGEF